MRILYVLSGMQKASGVTTFVENIANELRALGHVVEVRTQEEMEHIESFEIVHLHGLWSWLLHKTAVAASSAQVKLVWSPHGMLQPWALRNKWWKKFAALALYQYWDLRKADIIHVTAQSEVNDVRRLRLHNDIVVAPLGVRIKETGNVKMGERHTLLFVSRVQRKKGLPNLLASWARLPDALKSAWTIRIVGPDQDGHTAELMRQCESLGLAYSDQQGKLRSFSSTRDSNLHTQVAFVGPKYDAELDAEYDNADLFVLPTHSENFGSVVVEALAHSVPVICTKEAPWEELETRKCGWWIDDNVDALEKALREGMNSVEKGEHVVLGKNGLALVKDKYDWKVIGKTLAGAYWSIAHCREEGSGGD